MLLRLALLFAFAAATAVFDPDLFLLRDLSTIVLMAFSLALMLYFGEHILEKSTRRYLVGIAALITLWIVLRGAKYIAFEETERIARHIWYLYYVPALLIPLLSLFAALSVGAQREAAPRGTMWIATGVTLVMTALVLTNDLHQLVFRFQPGFRNWDSDYLHTPLFYAVYGWIALEFIGVIVILFSRCRVSASRKLVWVPLLPALFGITYLTLYAAGAWPRVNGQLFGEFPEAVCFSMAGIWLGLLYIGLIPSNIGYGRLFACSALAAQIADRDYRVIYRNPNAAPLSLQQRRSDTLVTLDRNTRIHRKEIPGGYVYWQDDVTALNRINEALWEVGERLGEEAALTRLENELKVERAQIEAKSRTYDEIAKNVLPQSRQISELCALAGNAPERYAAHMKTVCLLAVYIKRYANLSLLAAERAETEANELYLAVQESLRAVDEMGIPTSSACDAAYAVPAKSALEAYALFESCLERALPTLRGVQVSIRTDALHCVFEGAAPELPARCAAALTLEDGNAYLRVPLREAGDAV
jgi:hypothetical protein